MEIKEIDLARLKPGGELRQAFEALHRQDWLDQGIFRWLELIGPQGPWPVVVLGAEQDRALLGTIVGVWAQQPVERFDDLLENRCPQGYQGADRPRGGSWHFVAVTTDPQRRQLALGRPLLAAALAWVQSQLGAEMRTLSPAVGLQDALEKLPPGEDFRGQVRRILLRLARTDGAAHLAILGLHPAQGAQLEKILWQSRADEKRSAQLTLRFKYRLDDAERAQQQQAYRDWLELRRQCIAQGQAKQAELPERWWLPDHPEQAGLNGQTAWRDDLIVLDL